MNLNDMLEKLWQVTGYPDTSSDRQDFRLQLYKDALNDTLNEICSTCVPSLHGLTRETTLSLVAGTSLYRLDDWCQRPLSIYTTDGSAHKVKFVRPRIADAMGLRSGTFVYPNSGPYTLTDGMRTSTALYSGSPTTTTGATTTEGSTTITFGASTTDMRTLNIAGRMFRINGESDDYKIVAATGALTITVDKPVRGRIRGVGVTNVGAGYSDVPWEISPTQRFQIKVLPAPTVASTLSYRFMAYPRRMINTTDQPEIQENFHHLIWKGALGLIGAEKMNNDLYQMWRREYLTGLSMLQKDDIDEFDSSDAPAYETIYGGGNAAGDFGRGVEHGYYSRRGNNWY